MFRQSLLATLLAGLFLIGCGRAPETLEQASMHPLDAFEERNDDPIAAAADRYQRRLSADGTVPERALMRAKEQRDAMLFGRATSDPVVWPRDWEWVGPGNIGGRLRPIVIQPNNPDTMYVGSASGGIWKTLDGGQSWFVLDDFLASLSVGDMVMHPTDFNTLFVGTGEGFFEALEGSSNTAAVRGAGIFKSTDAGSTWVQIPTTDNPDFYFVNRLEFDPSNSSRMFAATGTGIWLSEDGGDSWTLQEAFQALDIKFNPNNPLLVVAGGHHTHDGPYYSTDGGVTWQLANGAGGHRQEMAWAPSEPNTVYAAVSDDPGRIKVWISTDGGQNYTLQTTGNGMQTWASYNNTIWVDPGDSSVVVVGGVRLFRSTDSGETFAQRFNSVHPDMHRVVHHPGFDGVDNRIVYFATDGGIYQTNNIYGNSAFNLNNNLGVTQFYGGGINPTTGDIIGGTQDNGTLFYSGDPQNWDHIFGGDGGYGAADPTDPDYFYGEVQRAYLHRSRNGGQSSSYIWNGPNPIQDAGSLSTNFIPFFMLDPNNSNRMLVACERMWRSNNVKDDQPDWFSIKDSVAPPKRSRGGKGTKGGKPSDPDESHFDPNSPYNIATIAVADGNSDIIWAGHNNGELYLTTDGTADAPTWIRVDENGNGLPDRWISTIVIDQQDHNHVYVAFMGWESDNLWETTDNGDTWNDISGAVPDAPISALAIHRYVPGWLYIGTDVGIFTSHDNGQTWSTQAVGPGTVPVEQLLWKDNTTLLAVTHGRGMYLGTEPVVVPLADKLLDGVAVGGSLSDVASGDGQYYELDPSPTQNPVKQIVDVIVQSLSPTTSPSNFQFRLKARMEGGPSGDVDQIIWFFNHDTNKFEVVDSRPAASVMDETVVVVPDGDNTRFVDPGSSEVTARVTWKSESFAGSTFTWTIDIDEAVWMITGED